MCEQLALPRHGPGPAAATRRLGAVAAVAIVLVALGSCVGSSLVELAAPQASPMPGGELGPVWIGLLLVYAIAMALPFVPGIEIGLALMLLLGTDGVVLVYAATQFALAISFLCGRCLPRPYLAKLIDTLRPDAAQTLLSCIDTAGPAQRMQCLVARSSTPWLRRLLRHRHFALALLMNMPGNALLGGAGGIAMLAGAMRLFGFARLVVLMALATAPLPALLLWRGPA